jgi:uncharacterized protein YjbJ (UPF0337 family)
MPLDAIDPPRRYAIEHSRPEVRLGKLGHIMWNKNERDGKVDEIKGKAKQAVGRATNDPDLVEEGQVDETAGKTQATIGTATRKVGEAVEKLGETIKK